MNFFPANTEVMTPIQTGYIHEEPGKIFDKTVLLPEDAISEIFWVELFGRDSQEASCGVVVCGCKPTCLWCPVWEFTGTPLPCSWRCQHTGGLWQGQKSQKLQFWAFEGISELGSGRPQRFRALCWCGSVPGTEGFPALSESSWVLYPLYSRNTELPWLLFHSGNKIFWRLRGFILQKRTRNWNPISFLHFWKPVLWTVLFLGTFFCCDKLGLYLPSPTDLLRKF